MMLTGREHELGELGRWLDRARAGCGGLVLVRGDSGAGKTAFVETFLERWCAGDRVLASACDPLSTPRPLGAIHDVADQLGPVTQSRLRDSDQPHEIFAAVFEELTGQPSVLVIDDMHWADQATIDLYRYVLRRVTRTRSLAVGVVRDDEIGAGHPMRSLLGDVARSPHAGTLVVPPLSLDAVTALIGWRDVDAAWLHRVTGGNAFFVCEMLDHTGSDLPTTVRDAILARTADLDAAAWDLLHLLACAPGAIPDRLLGDLGVGLPALRTLHEAKLIRRSSRGVAFRHDLCRLAVSGVLPPGAEPELHRRFIDAYERCGDVDPAVITHHAVRAGDSDRIRHAAAEAGHAAARTGAHTQATEFFRLALDHKGELTAAAEAELLECLAGEYYLTDRLDEAISSCRRAMDIRRSLGASVEVSADHHALAVYQWYNANRVAAEDHVAQAISVLSNDGGRETQAALAQLGHAFAMQAFLAVQTSDLTQAGALITQARQIAGRTCDPALDVRIALIEGYCAMLSGREDARDDVLSVLRSGPRHIDEVYSSGYSNLSYLDVEQRRLRQATELLDVSLPLMVEYDLPVCRVWQLGSRSRLALMVGNWADAAADARAVLDSPGAPLARTWPLLIHALVSMRRDGSGAEVLDEAWALAQRYQEPLRLLPVAAAITERSWLTGVPDDRLERCRELLERHRGDGLQWARGELAVWLSRLDPAGLGETTGVAEPYRLLLDGDHLAAAEMFDRLGTPYDAALALTDSGETGPARRGLDILDGLGAAEVAARVRRELRARGITAVPARRRATTLANPEGLTVRQIDVLRLLDAGLTNAEMAERLYLSVKTVDHHVSAILDKLGVGNRRDAVRRARELGVLG